MCIGSSSLEWIIRMSRVHVTTLNVATQPFVLQIYVHRAHIYVSACVCARTSRRQDVRMCVALRTARDHDIVQLRYATLIQPLSLSSFPRSPAPFRTNARSLHSLTLLRHLASRNFVSSASVSGLRVNSRRVIRWGDVVGVC